MESQKEELLSLLENIALSEFFTKNEKDAVLQLVVKGNKKTDELVELLRKYLVAKVSTGVNELSK